MTTNPVTECWFVSIWQQLCLTDGGWAEAEGDQHKSQVAATGWLSPQ